MAKKEKPVREPVKIEGEVRKWTIFSHIEELKEFLAAWNAKQTYRYWMVDPTRVIIADGA